MHTRVEEPILIPCDLVLREPKTNKAHLQGVFNKVLVSGFPSHLDCWLYVSFYLKEATHGRCPIQFSIDRPGGAVDVLPPFEFAVTDTRVEGDVHLQQVPVIESGIHRIGLWVDGTLVTSVRIYIEPATTSLAPGSRAAN